MKFRNTNLKTETCTTVNSTTTGLSSNTSIFQGGIKCSTPNQDLQPVSYALLRESTELRFVTTTSHIVSPNTKATSPILTDTLVKY